MRNPIVLRSQISKQNKEQIKQVFTMLTVDVPEITRSSVTQTMLHVLKTEQDT